MNRADSKPQIEEARGNLLSLFDKGMEFFDRRAGLTRTGKIGSGYRDDLEVPERALREALVNALIHRDYETVEARRQPTRVDVYSDRIEISSYGGLMEGVDLMALNADAETVHPMRRNEIITAISAYFQHAELNASGIARIQHDVLVRQLPKPLIELVDEKAFVRIVLYRPLLAERVVGSRFTAYVGSTAEDLWEHREQVRLACESAGFAPERVENLSAVDRNTVDMSLMMIDQADVYLGIFGDRYGWIPDGADISVEEMEYNRAVMLNKPRLVFLIDEDHPVFARNVERGSGATKLAALKRRIRKDQVTGIFKSPGDLRGHVVAALRELRERLGARIAEAATSTRIFLAYASEGKPRVRKLYADLKARGLDPWLDERDLLPGQNWKSEIPRAIRGAGIVLACLSRSSVEKRSFVQRELRLALSAVAERPAGSTYLIPVRLDDCEVPDFGIATGGLSLRDLHWVDLWQEDGFDRLVRAIEHALGRRVGTSTSESQRSMANTKNVLE